MARSRSTTPVTRRSALASLAGGGLGLALTSTGREVAAQEASPGAMASHPLVGTWIVQLEDPSQAPSVAIYGADGSFVDAGNGRAGVWQPTGPRTALHTWVRVFSENANYLVISGPVEVDASGEHFTHPYSSMSVGASGQVVSTDKGTVHARKLHPVPEDKIGTALDVVPTWTPAAATPTAVASPAAEGTVVQLTLADYTITASMTTFKVGQPYTFVATNIGKVVHEAVLENRGAVDVPLQLGNELAEVDDIQPGEHASFTWTFTAAGPYQFGCHVPGHYEQGMVLDIEVAG